MKIKKGATRYVFLIGKYAIKIPCLSSWRLFLNGLLSNMQEKAFWDGLHNKFLAKIYYANFMGFILIMERADSVCSKYDKTLPEFFLKCKKAYLPVDPKADNVGKFNGNKKLIDYGN